jgi:hypothetical protein
MTCLHRTRPTVRRAGRRRMAALFAVTFGLAGAATSPALAATDRTAPVIVPRITGERSSSGWYLTSPTVTWAVSDPESGIKKTKGCETTTLGDTKGTTLRCRAKNKDALVVTSLVTVRVDRRAPSVTRAVPSRRADRNGWFNRPVTFELRGADATSGIAHCSVRRYTGPESADGKIAGRCRDRAGNWSARKVFRVKYDKTPPAVRASFERPPDSYGWYGHGIRIRFRGTDELSGVERCSPARTYRGPNSKRASESGSCIDRAGNRRTRTVRFKFWHPLLSPAAGSRLDERPVLRWVEVAGARSYNVQLWHDGKVLSRWPEANRYPVPRTWVYAGVRHRLEPGRYRWYVWPRFRHRYGTLIGKSSFVIRSG